MPKEQHKKVKWLILCDVSMKGGRQKRIWKEQGFHGNSRLGDYVGGVGKKKKWNEWLCLGWSTRIDEQLAVGKSEEKKELWGEGVGFRRKEEFVVDLLSLNTQDIWVEVLSRQLDLYPVTGKKKQKDLSCQPKSSRWKYGYG